jgi:hypothetical protein
MGISGSVGVQARGLKAFIEAIKEEDEYANTITLRPVREVIVHSFIHPKDPSNPNSITTGLLTGGYPLWGFIVDGDYETAELFYYVYDTKIVEHRVDGTWVVEHTDLTLVKAQIGVEGYHPELKEMLRKSYFLHAGYTKFSDGLIHRACAFPFMRADRVAKELVKWAGCLHAKQPFLKPRWPQINIPSALVELISEHRLRPPVSMPFGDQAIVRQLLDYLTAVTSGFISSSHRLLPACRVLGVSTRLLS